MVSVVAVYARTCNRAFELFGVLTQRDGSSWFLLPSPEAIHTLRCDTLNPYTLSPYTLNPKPLKPKPLHPKP